MNSRDQWQALQRHLNYARLALDDGDRSLALEQVDAALAIDGDYLAAQILRERILEYAPAHSIVRETPPQTDNPQEADTAPAEAAVEPLAGRPLVSREGLVRFEARARQRRVDRRISAARIAIGRRRFADAMLALDEVRELDPDHPDLISLAIELDETEHARRGAVGPWVVAAAVFGGIMLGATWVESPDGLIRYPIMGLGVLAPDMPSIESAVASEPTPELTTAVASDGLSAVARDELSDRGPFATAPGTPAITPAVAVARPPAITPAVVAARTPDPTPAFAPPVVVASTPASGVIDRAPISADVAPSVREVATPPPAPAIPLARSSLVDAAVIVPLIPDDEERVKQTLQRYRSAYEGLDVRLARAVWPAVNQPALERAFQGLESQHLTFDACDVQLRGAAATAVCHGTTRYVPKVGSRQPHVESRVWNFTLRKAGEDWTIENARAER